MKKSEIKDLYNQSDSALRMLKAMTLLLPYAKGDKAIIEAIDTAAHLETIVKTMCDYMIDDGSTDMRERLQVIKSEATQIESNVAKMGYSKERFALMLNCRAIINNIKDMEEWTANGVEPQHETHPEPQQTINAPSWENLTDDEKWLFHCKADYDSFINSCTNNKQDPKGVAEYYIDTIHNIKLDSKFGARKQLHKLLEKWGIVKVQYEHFNKVLNQQFRA